MKKVEKLAEFIRGSERIVVFTGAGISTDSGISDYRSKGGLWDRYQPVTYQEFLSSFEKRKEYWRSKMDLYESFREAKPNVGHVAIFELEKFGKLKGVITQNIDGLHEMAGHSASRVLQLHGTNRETICLSCAEVTVWNQVYERLKTGEESPLCERCQGLLKPNTISFGQNLDPIVLDEAFRWAKECDLLLAIGSTLVVEPAASIPRIAKAHGAKLVIITASVTPLDNLADLKIEETIGAVLSQAIDSPEIRGYFKDQGRIPHAK